ncbi:hypothetical protein E4T56_gene9606, partial [Termitomyces sp. T112]
NPRRHDQSKLGQIFYFFPAADRFIKEIDAISCCDSAVMRWSTQKALEQDARIKHARLCETWSRSFHWVFQSDRSLDFNVIIIPVLIILLGFIWREKIVNMFAPSLPIYLQ